MATKSMNMIDSRSSVRVPVRVVVTALSSKFKIKQYIVERIPKLEILLTNPKSPPTARTISEGTEGRRPQSIGTMTNIRPAIRSTINNLLDSQDGFHSKIDILRVIEEEAMLMKETQHIIEVLDSDPMEQFDNVKYQIERLKKIVRVQSISRIRATNDFCKIDAVVGFEKCDNLQLAFRYERMRRSDEEGKLSKEGSHIRYSIQMSVNHQQRENLLLVEVWADKNWPSIQKAVCINQQYSDAANDEDDGWEDIEDDDGDGDGGVTEEEPIIKQDHPKDKEGCPSTKEANPKRQKLSDIPETNGNLVAKEDANDDDKGTNSDSSNKENDDPDSYVAHIDPDVLNDFLQVAGIQSKKEDEMHEGTAFFLLMTFPFYEQEWDLVGFILEEVFGGEEA